MTENSWKKRDWESSDMLNFCPCHAVGGMTLLGEEQQPSSCRLVNRNKLPTREITTRAPVDCCADCAPHNPRGRPLHSFTSGRVVPPGRDLRCSAHAPGTEQGAFCVAIGGGPDWHPPCDFSLIKTLNPLLQLVLPYRTFRGIFVSIHVVSVSSVVFVKPSVLVSGLENRSLELFFMEWGYLDFAISFLLRKA